jgi:hypothetical protein
VRKSGRWFFARNDAHSKGEAASTANSGRAPAVVQRAHLARQNNNNIAKESDIFLHEIQIFLAESARLFTSSAAVFSIYIWEYRIRRASTLRYALLPRRQEART